MTNNVLLEVNDLTVSFGGVMAVKPLSLTIDRGEVRAIVGPNGAGKSTVVNALTGFVRATGGRVMLDSVSMSGMKPHQRARAGMARTFQNIRLFGGMTALETAVTGAHATLSEGFFGTLRGSGAVRHIEMEAASEALATLEVVGLPSSLVHRVATTLSYGQQRRVEIARALMSKPKLLLLDEPVAGMTVAEKHEIAELVQSLRARGLTILLIEHDMGFVRRLSDRITVLHHGAKLACGAPDAVLADAEVRAAYLGRSAA
ncbi:ABC transporter ATP-binding protein [Ensifer adhaerens]|uniref:ABC transporter ATP-binding protein n=1 Tax=Ensifer adhaerens TaxID=106592 RepID=UPI000FDACFEE|nr:ABC transporter ATP-binding protein [Ensifer adhaerens]MDF8357554.1 ABC transporter ATP-binding protein [Ensifer adhaerens]THA61022.1 ABC transporter ATP-binding protein [Ensifer adhaerens]